MLIRIGTRSSKLAVAQAEEVQQSLQSRGSQEVQIVTISTKGDLNKQTPVYKIGIGVFVNELQQSLEKQNIEVAVHSLKDLPSFVPSEFAIAVLKRADPRDALISKNGYTIDTLPKGATVGTGSARRISQLLHRRTDIKVVHIRGNVDTRIATLYKPESTLDAVIVACAGLERLGFTSLITQRLDTNEFVPAARQGVIGMQTLTDNSHITELCRKVEHRQTAICSEAERTFLNLLNTGCTSPVGVYASLYIQNNTETCKIVGFVGTPDGSQILQSQRYGSAKQANLMATDLADELIIKGANKLLASQS